MDLIFPLRSFFCGAQVAQLKAAHVELKNQLARVPGDSLASTATTSKVASPAQPKGGAVAAAAAAATAAPGGNSSKKGSQWTQCKTSDVRAERIRRKTIRSSSGA